MKDLNNTASTKTAIFAGGCFWCVEADFDKLSGIINVVSGYSGGAHDNPKYKDYVDSGHREVVEVTYDPQKTSYRSLVEHLIFYSDPTDIRGSFNDRGIQYAPAIYYDNEEELSIAQKVIKEVDAKKIYDKPLMIQLLPRKKFWPAEDYHQGYYKKNPLRYKLYRTASGREGFVEKHKEKAREKNFHLEIDKPIAVPKNLNFENYQKPSAEELKKRLTPLQYGVTQEEKTEKPFKNEYSDNEAEGIYVDRISGAPLFSSKDKYDSKTGWPSFTKPIDPKNVVLYEDKKLLTTRIEVRSRYGDSHLGHVFDDGPTDRGGERYCMNSAALVFIPKEKMKDMGYEKYLYLFA